MIDSFFRRPSRLRALSIASVFFVALLAACGPALSVRTADEKHPQTIALVVAASQLSLPGRYPATHGKLVSGVATPWAEEVAEYMQVDPKRVARILGIDDVAPGRTPVNLMSPAHQTGDWSYVYSETARIYQILPVRPDAVQLIVLAAAMPPDIQLHGAPTSSWILGVLRDGDEKAAVLRLETYLPPAGADADLWDGIATSVRTVDGEIAVDIEYSHTGGGDACEQQFSFRARVVDGPGLELVRADHKAAACPALGL